MGFAFLAVFGFTMIGIWPALQFEGLKLAEMHGVSPHRLIWGMALGLVVGLGAGYVFSLETIYEHGLFALQEQGGARSEARIGRYYNYLFKDAGTVDGGTDWVRLGFHAVGAGCTYFLALMRQHFLRWPLASDGLCVWHGVWLAGCGGQCCAAGCVSGWRCATAEHRPTGGSCRFSWG